MIETFLDYLMVILGVALMVALLFFATENLPKPC